MFHVEQAFEAVAALYEPPVFLKINEIPAVIHRRYSPICP
jgi:hypothetical protein